MRVREWDEMGLACWSAVIVRLDFELRLRLRLQE